MELTKLTKIERLMLSNQYKILEKLYPDEREYFEVDRKAIEEGYELHYEEITGHIHDGLTSSQCREVLDILSMYRAITFSFEKLKEEEQLEVKSKCYITFKGFDGNDAEEAALLMYTKYFIMDKNRFHELRGDEKYRSFNSHTPMLQTYRARLRAYNELSDQHNLSKDDLITLLSTY